MLTPNDLSVLILCEENKSVECAVLRWLFIDTFLRKQKESEILMISNGKHHLLISNADIQLTDKTAFPILRSAKGSSSQNQIKKRSKPSLKELYNICAVQNTR